MEAFTAKDWEQLGKINNAGVKEAMDQMRTIMSSPDQRQLIWSRRMAQMNYESQLASACAEGTIKTLWNLVRRQKLTEEEAAAEAGMTVTEFKKQAALFISDHQ